MVGDSLAQNADHRAGGRAGFDNIAVFGVRKMVLQGELG